MLETIYTIFISTLTNIPIGNIYKKMKSFKRVKK